MRLGEDGFFELTYCTNIHPAHGWGDVLESIGRHAPALRERLNPDAPFGLGLRLSGEESRELLAPGRLAEFREFLDDRGLYVFTLNGFPHGSFHGGPVKAAVHAPDWRTEERVHYTLRLVEILAALLPEGGEGGISTSPLSYRAWVDMGDRATWELLTANLVRVAEALVAVRREHGTLIHLDIEPEADGLLEDSGELVAFYEQWLLEAGAESLARALGTSKPEAAALLLEHIRVCFDVCHSSVAYEEPEAVLDRYAAAGIRVGKVQLSAALRTGLSPSVGAGREGIEQQLRPLAGSIYLHQVVQRNGDATFTSYPDLHEALARLDDPTAEEWRVHVHVPIFADAYGDLLSTREELRRVLALLRERRFTRHLEIETYTWSVLPPAFRTELVGSIAREYEWVLTSLGAELDPR